MRTVRELFTAWGVECPPSISAGRDSNRCSGCSHPDGIFELLDVDSAAFEWGCSASSLPEFVGFREALWAISEVEGALSAPDVAELLEVSSFAGADSPFLDSLGRSLRSRLEERIHERLRERRDDLLSFLRERFAVPLEGPWTFVHYTSSYDFWWNSRVFSALYRKVSLTVDVPTTMEEGVFLVPERLFEALAQVEYAQSLDLDCGSRPLLLADWEGIAETVAFEEGDLECLEVAMGLLPELGLSRAFESARALRRLP